jgi:hypothetical protein
LIFTDDNFVIFESYFEHFKFSFYKIKFKIN